ncbi:MAG TPA: DNA primase [Streptosporangiaceae bacterium]|nr:DNA primase [Streptosporangiaceae bacterium]
MAGRIRDEDVALVRERSAIDEVVGDYLQLRNAGGSLKGLCPFHDEKTPSFHVTPARGLWYCFSCTEGGDVIKFVQKIDNLGFTEAVERLANRAGIELRYEQGGHIPGQEQSQRRRLIEAHKTAAEFYAEQLDSPAAKAGRDFLASRGFELADARRFGVGYAPAEWEALTKHLRGRGFTETELLAGGLASQGRRGLIDKFRGRLMWPIADVTGHVIAFGARKLAADDDGPKYLNTPETPLFKKSAVLYGADLAKRDIAQRRQAVLVEGYTDVMACHLAGITTAVATSGTAFGDGHITILRRLLMDDSQFRGEVIFTFDGDAAGQRAALRAFSMEERFVTQTFVAVQADGLDPCDLRVARGDAAVRDLIAQRVPLFEFAIRSVLHDHNLDTTEGRLAALDAAAPIVARIKDKGLRNRYAVNLDRWLGLMDEAFVLDRVQSHSGRSEKQTARNGNGAAGRHLVGAQAAAPGQRAMADVAAAGFGEPRPARAGQAQPRSPYDLLDPVVNVERQALKLAIQRPALCGPAFDELPSSVFTVPAHAALCELIAGSGGVASAHTAREWSERLRAAAPNDNARGFVTRLAVEPLEVPGATGEPDVRFAEAVLARVEELSVSRQIASIKSRLQRLSPVTEQADYNRMFGDLVAFEQRRKVLSERASGAL